jgi:hypothetical protein
MGETIDTGNSFFEDIDDAIDFLERMRERVENE